MKKIRDRVAALQKLLAARHIQAYVVPSSDPHQSEYVADAWKRREYISGFTGSAGLFACTQNEAGLWTDGRYWVQGEAELKDTGIQLFKQGDAGVPDWKEWMLRSLKAGDRVGFHPHLFSLDQHQAMEASLKAGGIELLACEPDLVDEVWAADRPAIPRAPLREHRMEHAGESFGQKWVRLKSVLRERKAQALVISALDELAWFLNLRGADVGYNPVFYGFALVEEKRVSVFVDGPKVSESLRQSFGKDVSFLPYEALASSLSNLSKDLPVWLDPATSSYAVAKVLRDAAIPILRDVSPLPAWKAKKNAAELAGMRAAHVRDGVALLRFWRWFEAEAPKGELDEIKVADVLEQFRAKEQHFRGPSFASIAGFAGHGALPHYRSTAESNVKLKAPGIFLLDSGGQYDDGTTDITRTFALGQPTAKQKEVYTRVLKGHLLLARSEFPQGTNGYQLDVLARQPLWQFGLDYGHGTGHGVGAALCVHEGPFSVSLRKNMIALEEGHILSNEPACYFVGEFGVRIENLITVVKKTKTAFGEFLGFEDLTVFPYDRRLIELSYLSDEERKQVDRYHTKVVAALSPFLNAEEQAFLHEWCAPL